MASSETVGVPTLSTVAPIIVPSVAAYMLCSVEAAAVAPSKLGKMMRTTTFTLAAVAVISTSMAAGNRLRRAVRAAAASKSSTVPATVKL